jgi:hypothetical protein
LYLRNSTAFFCLSSGFQILGFSPRLGRFVHCQAKRVHGLLNPLLERHQLVHAASFRDMSARLIASASRSIPYFSKKPWWPKPLNTLRIAGELVVNLLMVAGTKWSHQPRIAAEPARLVGIAGHMVKARCSTADQTAERSDKVMVALDAHRLVMALGLQGGLA